MAKNSEKPRTANHFIREWRTFRKVTQEQLAAAIDVTSGAISQLETGKINYTQPTLEAIAAALNCHVAALLLWPPKNREKAVHSALLAYGLHEDQIPAAMVTINGFERDAEQQRQRQLGDQSESSNPRRAKEPS